MHQSYFEEPSGLLTKKRTTDPLCGGPRKLGRDFASRRLGAKKGCTQSIDSRATLDGGIVNGGPKATS